MCFVVYGRGVYVVLTKVGRTPASCAVRRKTAVNVCTRKQGKQTYSKMKKKKTKKNNKKEKKKEKKRKNE